MTQREARVQLAMTEVLPVAASGSFDAKSLAPTNDRPSAAVTKTSCAAATGWLTNHVKLTRAKAVGRSDVALDLYPPTSREAPTHVPQTVMAKDRNSSKRMGLKCIGASQPGKLGMSMIAVICGTLHLVVHLSNLAKAVEGEQT